VLSSDGAVGAARVHHEAGGFAGRSIVIDHGARSEMEQSRVVLLVEASARRGGVLRDSDVSQVEVACLVKNAATEIFESGSGAATMAVAAGELDARD
jgi:tRNA A58 N-methylase Trm61